MAASRDLAIDLLLVCTANQARSPAAELLFRREVRARRGPGHGLVIRSAGVYASPGAPLLSTMAAALHRRGLGGDDFRSRAVSADELEASRLVITMTEAHRREVNRLAPSVVARSYTLPEVDRLVSAPQWEKAWDGTRDAFDRMRRLRPLVPRPQTPEDVVDPAGHGPDVAEDVLDELIERVGRISAHLFGSVRETSS